MVEGSSTCEIKNRPRLLKKRSFYQRYSWQPFCFVDDKCSSPAHNSAEKDLTNPMLTAHRQEPRSGAPSLTAGTQPGGFAKVLTSIQGLQQRLDGFSVDEANQAEANVHTLIEKLSLLEMKLSRLAELKQFVSSANRLISEIPEENFEQVDLNGLENHPQLHAILQASKLIRVHKLMQAAKAGAEAVSFDPQAISLPIQTSESSPVSSTEHMLLSPPPTSLANETEVSDVAGASNSRLEKVPEQSWVLGTEADLDNAEPLFVARAMQGTAAAGAESTAQDISKLPKPIDNGEKNLAVRDTGFDERLLSDLIQAYGEFSPVSKPSAGATTPKTASPVSAESEIRRSGKTPVPAAESTVPNSPSVQEPVRENLVQESESTGFALVPANVPILAKPELERPERATEKPTLPKVTKHGELDRQLKNIIKDYGEYDLYSHQSSSNIKMAALAAFAVLALVLGGLYFFKSPAPATNAASSSITQPSDASRTTEDAAGRALQSEKQTK